MRLCRKLRFVNNYDGSRLLSRLLGKPKQWPALADKTRNISELRDEEISAIEEAVASLSQDGPSS